MSEMRDETEGQNGDESARGQHRAEASGSVGEEATRLMSAAQDWFQRNLASAPTPAIATGAPECTWCPVCQVIGVLRGDRPDLTERFAETQTALAGLLHAMTDAVTSAMSSHAHGAPGQAGPTTQPGQSGQAGQPGQPGQPGQSGSAPSGTNGGANGARVHKIPLDIQRPAEKHISE